MLIFLIFCIGFVGCQLFDDKKFDLFPAKCSEVESVKIANVDYKFIDVEKNCLQKICTGIPVEGIYPYGTDLPIVRPHKTKVVVLKRVFPLSKNKKEVANIEKSIQDVDFIKSFPLFTIKDGIIITLQTYNQVLIVWNPDRTFLILVNPKSVQESYNITLGRDLIYYDSFMKLPMDFVNNNRLIFEISSSIIVKFGCQIISNDRNESTELPLSLSKYRLKNLGGERIFIQGPCLYNSEKIPNLEIQNKNNPNLIISNISLTPENSYFILLTPCLWYTGLYQFKISYQNYDFISDVEIYSIDGDSGNIEIKQIDQMNNPNYNKNYIALNIPNYSTAMNFSFYTFDLFSNDQNEIPLKVDKTLIRVGSFDKEVQIKFENIIDEKINIYQQIGFIGYVDQSKETKWTNSFSLIWMKNSVTNDYESQCIKTLSKTNVERNFCPYKLKQAAGLLSIFRILSSNTEYFSNYNETYICFAQVITGKNGVGVTCCYNKITNNLVYGQDFYLRNNIPIGSYSWKISPFYNLQKHFIRDLMPLHLCCSMISNELLCSEFWNKRNSMNIKSFEQDLRADVFGDPHFIPYYSSSKYSFLGKGDFQLILTKSNEFNLQGRFYYIGDKMKSLLKAIVFNISNMHISITTSINNKTNLNWKIVNKTNNQLNLIGVLPFQQENLSIFQSSDTTMLHIYMRLSNNSRIYIVLERIYYNDNILEFINMRVHLSNNMKYNIIGGLFGRIDDDSQSTGMYSLNSSNFIQNTTDPKAMFNFANSWYLTNEMNLFFDNFVILKDSYVEMPSEVSNEYCKNIDFCNLDVFFYRNDIVHIKTKTAYEYRVKLDQDWRSLNDETKVCDHPPIKMVKYNSDDFTEHSKLYIIGCIDPNKTISEKNQSMQCLKKFNSFELVWEHNFQNDICEKSNLPVPDKHTDTDNSVSGNEIVYAGIGVSVLLLVVLCSVVAFFFIKRKKSNKSKTKGDMELSTVSNMTLETTYDTVIGLQDEYCTYAEIQKSK